MKDYNEDYYLLFANPDFEEYDIEPDETSAKRNYDSTELDFGQKPLIFFTETPDLSFASSDYEVFFPIGSFVVTDKLKDELETGIPQKSAIFFRQRIVDIFQKYGVKGIRFFKVSEFENRDQH